MTISRLSPKHVLFYLLDALHSLRFAPKPLPTGVLPYLALICLTILLYQLNRLPTAKARIWPMFFFSFGHFTVGLYWIYISLHVYGDLSVIFSLAAVFFFTILLSSFYVATAVIHAWLFPIKLIEYRYQAFFNTLLWASIWSLFEWVRGTAFTGFPWLNIGYAQVDGPLAGWAVLFGAYGVTWVAVFTAAAFANFFFLQKRKSRGALVLLISAFLLNLGGLFLHGYHWSTPYEDPFYIRLTQRSDDTHL